MPTTDSADRDYIRLKMQQPGGAFEKRAGVDSRGNTTNIMLRPADERDIALQSIRVSGKHSSDSNELLPHGAAHGLT